MRRALLSTLLAKAVYSRLNERGKDDRITANPESPDGTHHADAEACRSEASWRLVCIFAMQRAAQSGRSAHRPPNARLDDTNSRVSFRRSMQIGKPPSQKPSRTPHPSGLCIPPACSAQAIAVISTNLFALNAGGPSSSGQRSPGPLLSPVSRPNSTRRNYWNLGPEQIGGARTLRRIDSTYAYTYTGLQAHGRG